MAYKKFHQSKLHGLLIDKLQHVPDLIVAGRIDPTEMAKRCGRCKFTVYRWMGGERLSLAAAKQIIALSEHEGAPTMTLEDLIPYL